MGCIFKFYFTYRPGVAETPHHAARRLRRRIRRAHKRLGDQVGWRYVPTNARAVLPLQQSSTPRVLQAIVAFRQGRSQAAAHLNRARLRIEGGLSVGRTASSRHPIAKFWPRSDFVRSTRWSDARIFCGLTLACPCRSISTASFAALRPSRCAASEAVPGDQLPHPTLARRRSSQRAMTPAAWPSTAASSSIERSQSCVVIPI